jgi:enhancing lycopene biosynthesis protein 2
VNPYFTTSQVNENKRLSQSGPTTRDKRVKGSILSFIKTFRPPISSLTWHTRHHEEIRLDKTTSRTNFNNLDMPEIFFNLDRTFYKNSHHHNLRRNLMAKRIGVILSGCGVYDGSEIHEAVITLLAIDRAGAEAVCMAPDIPQMHVINHLSGEPEAGATRNVLIESARIARGNIQDLAKVQASDLDALILPGGFGAAKNLCNFAVAGADCEVNAETARLIREMYAAKKPIAAVCIAPAVLSKVLGDENISHKLTIGNDQGTAEALAALGTEHIPCPVDEFVIDHNNKLVSSPAYLLAGKISEAAEGIEKTVQALLGMID